MVSGRVSVVRPMQFLNASVPILRHPFGIVMLVTVAESESKANM